MPKKVDARSFALQKRRRRQWLTFVRMVRYGINNFSRNAWLTIAATAVMTITLLIVFMTLVARNTLETTVGDIRSKVDMSVYLKTDTSASDVDTVMKDIRALKTVTRAEFISPEEARQDYARQNSSDTSVLSALNEAENRFPGTVRVNLVDINDTGELDNYIKTNTHIKTHLDPNRAPSFAGERRTAIQNIGRWVEFADRAGLIMSIVFIAISSLIVFNTIRMAIFNRKEEIQMMKLIGADSGFIRGPFIVEAVVYGFIAALLATGIGILGLFAARERLSSYQIAIEPTLNFLLTYIGFVLLGMIVVGALIGVLSSLLATRRYLKL